METAAAYVGRVDREVVVERDTDRIYARMTSTTPIHSMINDIKNRIVDDMSPDVAAEVYLATRALRHDNWCEFITSCCTIRNHVVNDTKVETFIKDILGLDVQVPDEIKNKTPDILALGRSRNVVYLGDISVSVNPRAARARKHEKYLEVKTYLLSLGLTVSHVSFNVNIDCSNLSSEIHHLSAADFIDCDFDLVDLYKTYSLACNSLMTTIRDAVSDKQEFQRLIDASDSVTYTNPIMPDVPLEITQNVELSYKPKRTEDEIIAQIKSETDRRHNPTYFSKNINDSIKAMDNIIEKNRKRQHINPKSTLKVVDNPCDNVDKTDLDLITDYVDDLLNLEHNDIAEFLLHLLPNMTQIDLMKQAGNKKMTYKECRQNESMRNGMVYGKYQYKIMSNYNNLLVGKYKSEIIKGKKEVNVKKEPKVINLDNLEDYHDFISHSIEYYGSISSKPPVLPDTWEASTKFEHDSTIKYKEVYDYVIKTNGAQTCNAMAMLFDRISHLGTSLSTKDNIFVPPNGSFIAIIPGNHAPITSKNVDLPFVFITRCVKGKTLRHIESEYYCETDKYVYYASKLCRLNIDKMSNWSNASFKLIATASYLLSKSDTLATCKRKVIGTLTYFILDIHQKTSEYLDLFKYIAFMPFADISRLPNLIEDKMDLLIKTRLDAWTFKQLKWFITELGDLSKLNAVKPKIRKFQTDVLPSCLGITMDLPSFCNPSVRYKKPEDFIEEINVMNTVRPKHLYGSQFMDKSITQTCEWNIEFLDEIEKHGKWATEGHDDTSFPFDAKFCFSSDAIFYAEQKINKEYSFSKNKVQNHLGNSVYSGFMHKNTNLRGCTKSIKDRKNAIDIHTTSLEACLREYEAQGYNDEKCTVVSFGIRSIKEGEPQQYSMSAKDQRGSGRPIATPTIGTKAELMLVEKPEASKGKFMPNNIIVGGKNKLREQCETYKQAISEGTRRGFKMAFQLTEDQTKYSENDNTRKFLTYIKCNETLSPDIRALQYKVIERSIGRHHLIKRMPIGVTQNEKLNRYIIDNDHSLGVEAIIGWPQGMFNFISTNVHCAADVWITHAYNRAYPSNQVYTKGLVHSDDSWVVVCCNTVDDFERFSIFRMLAKRMFCLKLNEKKLWGSRVLGELVSNYNLNGSVHSSVGKMLANSFGNLCFQNWPIDVHNQISSLQQCYRNGASIGVIVMLATLLKQQMLRTYSVKDRQLELLEVLPIELGGYPSCSAFELAVTGVTCYYKKLLDLCKKRPDSPTRKLIEQCLEWSMNSTRRSVESLTVDPKLEFRKRYYESITDPTEDWNNDDYVDLCIPTRGNIFSALHHIMPKSRKLSKTLEFINRIRDKFPTNGLQLIVTKPLSLAESIGHLCAQTVGMVYELAADKYTSSSRRMAISQMIQSSGKVVRVKEMKPMTFNELITFIELGPTRKIMKLDVIASAFSDDNDVVGITHDIVFHSTQELVDTDKRKIITKMPFIDDKFNTIGRMNDVLLKIIDLEQKTNLLYKYSKPDVSDETLVNDARLIINNFRSYFQYYDTVAACNIIAQQYFQTLKARLWTQPYLRSDCLTNFLSDLYGKTVSRDTNYRIHIFNGYVQEKTVNSDMTNTIYFTSVLNSIYPNSFKILRVDEAPVEEAIVKIDHTKLSEDEKMKYGVIQKIYTGNDDYLRRMHKSNLYRGKWIKPQKRYGNTYRGEFKAKCTMNNAVLVISGDEGDISLESNTTDVEIIQRIMRMFIIRNFRHYKYELPGAWGERGFWRSKARFSQFYLNYNTRQSSMIGNRTAYISLPIKINADLRYGEEPIGETVDGFSFDDSLRVISVISNRNTYRFASIRQNFTIPCSDRIELDPTFLQGFDTRVLYSTGAIKNLVMNNAASISSDTMNRIFTSGYSTINSGVVGELLANLLATVNRRKYYRVVKTVSEPQEEIVEVDIVGININRVVEINEMTSPEDLTCVEIEYHEGLQERTGSMVKVHDIRQVLCMAYIGVQSDKRIESLIYHLATDDTVMEWVDTILKDMSDDNDQFRDYLEYLCEENSIEISLTTYAFIVATRLNITEVWANMDIRDIVENINNVEHSERLLKIVNDITTVIAEIQSTDKSKKKTILTLMQA